MVEMGEKGILSCNSVSFAVSNSKTRGSKETVAANEGI